MARFNSCYEIYDSAIFELTMRLGVQKINRSISSVGDARALFARGIALICGRHSTLGARWALRPQKQ